MSTTTLELRDGKFLRNGEPEAPRFGDPDQTALLRRIERTVGEALKIDTESEHRYCAFCEWVCPSCGQKNDAKTDYEFEFSSCAKDEIVRLNHPWECACCGDKFNPVNIDGVYYLEPRKT